MQFTYKTTDYNGKIEYGQAEADSREQLIAILKSRGKIPLEIKSETKMHSSVRISRFSKKERLNFTQQLAGLLNAGISLEKALGILNRIILRGELANIIQQLQRLLQEGHSFTAALEKHPRHFPALYINMVRAGEAGGILPQVLDRLAKYQEEELNLRNFIISSLIYPVILGFASLGLLLLYMIVVVPKFEPIFAEMDTGIPLITKIVMLVGNCLNRYWIVLIVILISLIVTYFRLNSTQAGKQRIDQFKLQLPLLGGIFQKIAISRMSLALSMLAGSGVSLLQALAIAGTVSDNLVINNALQAVIGDVKQGNTLVNSMVNQKVFPTLAIEMIGIGEESGN
ncbi:MAG TPA: type II secretion system F family protein, partial [Bacillota bacterium]|nr:type II secretion system F family protein [Bacillota bacterium]HOL10809.1 type II secretion system F family protein [Bacillota bacterium]